MPKQHKVLTARDLQNDPQAVAKAFEELYNDSVEMDDEDLLEDGRDMMRRLAEALIRNDT